MDWILPSWGRVLTGYAPALSIEITRECAWCEPVAEDVAAAAIDLADLGGIVRASFSATIEAIWIGWKVP